MFVYIEQGDPVLLGFFTYKSMSERRSCLSVSLFIATLYRPEKFTAGSGLVRKGKRYNGPRE